MNTQETTAADDAEQATSVSEQVLNRFLSELSEREDMSGVSERLRTAFFNGEAVNENAFRDALFGDSEQ